MKREEGAKGDEGEKKTGRMRGRDEGSKGIREENEEGER